MKEPEAALADEVAVDLVGRLPRPSAGARGLPDGAHPADDAPADKRRLCRVAHPGRRGEHHVPLENSEQRKSRDLLPGPTMI